MTLVELNKDCVVVKDKIVGICRKGKNIDINVGFTTYVLEHDTEQQSIDEYNALKEILDDEPLDY